MTVVTTADTSQLYALAARHGLKLHGPLTVNELGLDYRIVIATVDDGRRWVLRIPRRAEVVPFKNCFLTMLNALFIVIKSSNVGLY